MRRLGLAAVVSLLVGCSPFFYVKGAYTRLLESVDMNDRSVTAPSGGGLTRAIRGEFAKRGWRVEVQGTESPHTRYTLGLRWQKSDLDFCLVPFEPSYKWEALLFDNTTGATVMTGWGGGCEGGIVGSVLYTLESGKLESGK